jgi:hypothetical protein
VLAIAEDHVNPSLLFTGTEFGLFFSIDGGQKWIQLKSGLPTIAVKDLNIQKREHDLIVGTFGRGIYIIDDYTPLRLIKAETLKQDAAVFPVKDALMYIQSQPLGGRGKSFQGERFFTADNPPFGATVTWYLKEAMKTRKEKRQEAEKEAEKKGQPVGWPTRADLIAEAEEEPPAIIIMITDSSDNVVRRLTGRPGAGIQRVTWDLRYPAANLSAAPPPDADFDFEPPSGPLVMPGTYKATVAKRVEGVVTPLGPPQVFQITVEGQEEMSVSDRAALVEFQNKAVRLQRAVSGATQAANSLRPRLTAVKRAIAETPALPQRLHDEATALEKRTNKILRELSGDTEARRRNMNTAPSINERVNYVVGVQRMSTSRPTQTQHNQYAAAAQDFETVLAQLRQLIEVDLARLEKQLEAAGAPWTPGRIPEWRN